MVATYKREVKPDLEVIETWPLVLVMKKFAGFMRGRGTHPQMTQVYPHK